MSVAAEDDTPFNAVTADADNAATELLIAWSVAVREAETASNVSDTCKANKSRELLAYELREASISVDGV